MPYLMEQRSAEQRAAKQHHDSVVPAAARLEQRLVNFTVPLVRKPYQIYYGSPIRFTMEEIYYGAQSNLLWNAHRQNNGPQSNTTTASSLQQPDSRKPNEIY